MVDIKSRGIEILLPPERIFIDEDRLTIGVVKKLKRDLNKVRDEYNKELTEKTDKINEIFKKYEDDLKRKDIPLGEKDSETRIENDEEFEKRVKPILDKRDKELEDFLPDEEESTTMKLAFKVLKVIADLVGQGHKVTPQNFENASWPKVKLGLAKLLLSNDCEIGQLFLPPRSLD